MNQRSGVAGAKRGPRLGGNGDVRGKPLTGQETLILYQFMYGGTARGIAEKLTISPKTVESHSRNIRAKLGAKTITQAVANYFRGIGNLVAAHDGTVES